MSITTHVLDTSLGRPAKAVPITLAYRKDSDWVELGRGTTDADGRLKTLVPDGHALVAGIYRICFDTAVYFEAQKTQGFYPEAAITFEITDPSQHHHVPLLLNPYGYSTYRGS